MTNHDDDSWGSGGHTGGGDDCDTGGHGGGDSWGYTGGGDGDHHSGGDSNDCDDGSGGHHSSGGDDHHHGGGDDYHHHGGGGHHGGGDDCHNPPPVPCFTPGTLIATPKGERLVEDLVPGDKVITRDNGIQEIRWAGKTALDWKELAANSHLKPILIRAGSLGDGLPERDMMVSPNHRILVANDRTALYFDEHEVLVAAKHVVNNQGIHAIDSMGTTYIHFMFDNHEVVLSNGAWTESFQPGDYTLSGMGNSQRSEIFELFPELQTSEGMEGYTAARKTLKRHEAALLGH
ncbi:Hint domain-containing protein [Acidimangrovimonas sediminis]|uniref:Hint domain-containing protein n=1 Tax=Acidimangrovimonas sediminis TaxID=2056283 RepID=UPI000C804342